MSKIPFNGDITTRVIEKIKREVKARLDGGEVDGNVDLWVLLLVSDMHSRISCIEDNPSFKFGNFYAKYPKLSWLIFSIASVIAISSILVTVLATLNKLGLTIAGVP